MSNVFEQPWTLLITAVVIFFVMLMLRKILPDKHHWWQLVLPVFIAASAFGLDFLIQTDTEKITSLINAGAKAVEQESPDAIEPIISYNYRDSLHRTKQALISHCRRVLSKPLVKKNIIRFISIDIDHQKATAVFTARMVFDEQSYAYDLKRQMFVKVQSDLRKQPDNSWLINRVEILKIDTQPLDWKDVKRLAW